MARKVELKEISGTVYEVSQVPPMVALKMVRRFMPIIVSLVGGVNEAALVGALHTLGDDDIEFITHAFTQVSKVQLSTTTAGGPGTATIPLVFNDHFAGKLGAAFQWLAFCFKVNFEDFLAEASTLLAEKQAKENPSKPQA